MFYAPHTLYRQRLDYISEDGYDIVTDEDGSPISLYGDDWLFIAQCRCDDEGQTEIVDDRGVLFRPQYHIVADKCDVRCGDIVRVEGRLKCGGRVRMVKTTNFYSYTQIWI